MRSTSDRQIANPAPIPARAGIGLRAPHVGELLERRPLVSWLEVHSENYFAPGGRAVAELDEVRRHYPLSLHGVGLSLGSMDPLDEEHLRKLSQAVARFEPMLVSEHLCWTSVGGSHLHDLLPLPYTEEALDHVAARIAMVQERLGRRMLIENVSSYLEFEHSAMPEWEFLREVATRSGCGILLDVNNIYVSAVNHGFDAHAYVDEIPAREVGEIHLAGHTRRELQDGTILIDSHDQPVADAVWALYDYALARLGPKPTLIEWDSSLPALDALLAEAAKAQTHLERRDAAAA
ncbi:MAG TPA: DUF692 domain-containing protein [Gammaproteobacteria bacterium]|nr:DUF692 domain-containing protein [Gammaproteobacteria bacterium]